MDSPKSDEFLNQVLGADGAQALKKAVAKLPALESLLLPRTLLSWVQMASQYGYQGPLPGLQKSFLDFRPGQDVGSFDGALTIGDDSIPFDNASVYRLAAHLAIALDIPEQPVDKNLHGLELDKLGRSIDLLIKSRMARQELKKMLSVADMAQRKAIFNAIPNRSKPTPLSQVAAPAPAPGVAVPPAGTVASPGRAAKPQLTSPDTTPAKPAAAIRPPSANAKFMMPSTHESASRKAIFNAIPGRGRSEGPSGITAGTPTADTHISGSATKVDKAELPGQTAKPQVQGAPMAPQAPQKQPRQQRQRKLPTLGVSKSEQEVCCPVCENPQFKDGLFVGCLCLRGLSKSVTQEPGKEDSVVLHFGADWSLSSLEVLIEALQG